LGQPVHDMCVACFLVVFLTIFVVYYYVTISYSISFCYPPFSAALLRYTCFLPFFPETNFLLIMTVGDPSL